LFVVTGRKKSKLRENLQKALSQGSQGKGGDKMSGVQVRSTNLRSVRYDPDKKLLEVELYANDRYQFFDVPATVYEELLKAESREQFFDRNIRLKYRHRRIFQI
jgi:hypothetical protein